MSCINFNGKLINETLAPPLIDGSNFRFANGLFESMLVIDGKLQLKKYHFERLAKGLMQLGLIPPAYFNEGFFEQETSKAVSGVGTRFQRVRFQVALSENFSFLAEASPVGEQIFSWNLEGWRLGFSDTCIRPLTNMAHLKKIDIRFYKKGYALAAQNGWDDVLLTDENFVIESGTANIFWIKNQQIYTPPVPAGCIEGCMRKYVLTTLRDNYKIHEKALRIQELFDADEVFLTNSLRRIKWVAQIKDSIYSNKRTSAIYSELFP